jgi:hypothetical protein
MSPFELTLVQAPVVVECYRETAENEISANAVRQRYGR